MMYICERCGEKFMEWLEADEHEKICGVPAEKIVKLVLATLNIMERKLEIQRITTTREQLSKREGDKFPYFNGMNYHNEGLEEDEKKVIHDLLFFALMRENGEAKVHHNIADWIVELMGKQPKMTGEGCDRNEGGKREELQ